MSETTRRLEYMPLDELRPDPRNPKQHAIDELRASVGRFGYVEPIVMDDRTGLLVAGHGRRELLLDDREHDREPPEGVDVDENGAWLVPVVRGWSSVDDDDAAAYLIASNRLVELGGWRPSALADLLTELEQGAGLDGVGYSKSDLDALISALAGPTPPDASPQMGAMEYRLLVSCESEQHQAELLARFAAEGLTCQALIA